LRDLLPVIDNLHRALAHSRAGREDDPILTGVELVLRGFDEVLERHGVKVVPARGTAFDPNRHEAISHVESDQPANTVIDEHQRGYVLHDRLLRPALVTVGKGPRPGDDGPPDVAKD
jgi:molecular chaperone GrpE